MLNKIAEAMNTLTAFCGKRDLDTLTKKELQEKFGLEKLDIVVLFGGSVLSGGDLLAEAIKNDLAHHYVIVGGYGHTSTFLFEAAEKEMPGITQGLASEAEVFQRYLQEKYQLTADELETKSTNCGNNITNLLDLIKEKTFSMKSILFIQEAAMQGRMEATFQKYVSEEVFLLNYASTQVSVVVEQGTLAFEQKPRHFWTMDHYRTLLMGEIPRLHDTEEGYGPKGKQFIAHVSVPTDVLAAYTFLKDVYPEATRLANPAFATKK